MVPEERVEPARGLMAELFPDGFEECDLPGALELVAYTDAEGEARLRAFFGEASATDLPDGWEGRWRDFHRPVRVGPLWIGPPWAEPPEDAVAVVVDPGRAFGTGGHATTRLCLGLILEQPRGSLLDVGCGSGVLAIAAAKLGFDPVVAVDQDPIAVEATSANAAANGVPVVAQVTDALVEPLPPVDLAVANLVLDAVAAVGPRLDCAALIASGYLETDQPVLPGFRATERRTRDGWAADLYVR